MSSPSTEIAHNQETKKAEKGAVPKEKWLKATMDLSHHPFREAKKKGMNNNKKEKIEQKNGASNLNRKT